VLVQQLTLFNHLLVRGRQHLWSQGQYRAAGQQGESAVRQVKITHTGQPPPPAWMSAPEGTKAVQISTAAGESAVRQVQHSSHFSTTSSCVDVSTCGHKGSTQQRDSKASQQ
jgi:hypothetical protein